MTKRDGQILLAICFALFLGSIAYTIYNNISHREKVTIEKMTEGPR